MKFAADWRLSSPFVHGVSVVNLWSAALDFNATTARTALNSRGCVLQRGARARSPRSKMAPPLVGPLAAGEPPAKSNCYDPHQNNSARSDKAYGGAFRGRGPDAIFLNHFRRHQSHYQGNAQRDDDEVVKIAQHRNEVRDQVNGR